MSFLTYPANKESGVDWLGNVPDHWKIYRSKNVFSERNIKAAESDEQLTASQKYGVIPQKLFCQLEDQKVMQVVLGRDILKKAEVNDFVISMRSFQGGLEFCSYNGAVSSAYVPLYACREISNRFFKHLFKSTPFISALQNTSNLVRDGQALRYNNFAQLSLPFPAISEQITIGAFLDHETARIDALIEEQQRLIELLKEKRQAVISHAVTKGLDPTVPMKDSGVAWLGYVPAHWGVCKLSFRYFVELGKMLDEKKNTGTNPLPYLRNQDVQQGVINTDGLPLIDIEPSEYERYTVRLGDLLVCEGGDVGRAAIWRHKDSRIGYQKALHRLRPESPTRDTAEFFFYSLMAAKTLGVFEESDMKATISHLPAEKFRQYRFAFPPFDDQQEIASVLECKLQRSNETISYAENTIGFLQERRSALISAAVTGKIDVRGWQPPTSAPSPASAQEAV